MEGVGARRPGIREQTLPARPRRGDLRSERLCMFRDGPSVCPIRVVLLDSFPLCSRSADDRCRAVATSVTARPTTPWTTERTVQDDRNLPSHLTIHLVRAAEVREDGAHGDWTETKFVASSPQFPNITLVADSSDGAVRDLLWQILDEQDLSPDVAAALKAAGHSDEVVSAWRGLAYGALNRHYRYDATESVRALQEYTDGGVPALVACRYIGQGVISAPLAIESYAAGGDPEDVFRYVHHSETYKWWKWDYDIDPWIRSGFPFARGELYAMDCSVEVAREWELVVAEYDIPDRDIRTLLRSTFTPAAARAHLEAGGSDASTLLEQARGTLPPEVQDPWASPTTPPVHCPHSRFTAAEPNDNPEGSGGGDVSEPAF